MKTKEIQKMEVATPVREITADEIELISGGAPKQASGGAFDFTIKTSVDTSGKGTIEASLTYHF